MPKKSSRRKQREAEHRARLRRRSHPDFIDGGRLNGYRRFCVFARIWWMVCPLLLIACLLLAEEIYFVAVFGVLVFFFSPFIIYLIRVSFFEAYLSCPHCEEPGEDRWCDWIFNTSRGNYKPGEGLRDIRPRRRYYRQLKKATDTYTCPYCGKTIYILPHEDYKKIRGKGRKN